MTTATLLVVLTLFALYMLTVTFLPVGIRWRTKRVRCISWGPKPKRPYHVTFTPHFAFSIPWFGKGLRLRVARHHGVQVVGWTGNRWSVFRQKLGTRSKVVGEPMDFMET